MMENKNKNLKVYWNKRLSDTQLEKFQVTIEKKYDVKFNSYWDLHEWTVRNYVKFWEELWHFFGILSSQPYYKVFLKTGSGFLDNEWFTGARLNYAENILMIRDDSIALMCLDELGNEETVTFADMFEEVKLYAAAFRKNGLKIGDRVACFMSNRKEAIFAMLAAVSIGAVWGGPVPYYGARAASKMISKMEPKFLITIDSHQDNGIIYPTLNYLQTIVDNAPTIQKVILLVTQEDTRKKDLSNIRNCIFIEDFLMEGRTPEGNIPEIIFEQLPFNHPLCINFTSGTTSEPKAVMHSIGAIISIMRDLALKYNMKKGDVACLKFPVGWNIWDTFVPSLALGVKLFVYCGNVFYSVKGKNFWDLIDHYNVKYLLLLTPSMADKMENMQICPSHGTSMTSLEVISIGGSPAKKNNFEYIHTKVKNDVFLGIEYGATEACGAFSGFNMNMPVYGGEIQVPSLGMDLQCFDEKGNSVIGQIGELVVCTPAINFPIGLWKEDSSKLTDIYLSKFPGIWTQHDECWINPVTKGIVILGRSDDTLKQKGLRFGAADIYCAIHSLHELQDYICVSQKKKDGDSRAVLFVKMREGLSLTPEIRVKIEKKVDEEFWFVCVPELIMEVPDIPYNLNNKKMESLVRKIIQTNTIPEVMNIRNPNSLKHYVNIPEILNYNR